MNPTTNIICTTQLKQCMQPWITPDLNYGMAKWQELAGGFDLISLVEMDGVALLNRLDTKYVMTTEQLWEALANLQQDYWLLEVDGQRINRYRTLYFDTPGFDLYHAHVNKRPERYKVRSREYADSHLAFLEVKHRTRKDRTIKDRIRTVEQVIAMTPEMTLWLGAVSPVDGSTLEPKLWNSFLRMTLVNKQWCERVTLDLRLAFAIDTRRLQLDSIAIAEVKMDGTMDDSYLREKVAGDIFRDAGVIAPETAFYEVYVDYGEGVQYFGLYPAVEIVDDTLIQTAFSDDSGNVYKPEGSGAAFGEGMYNEESFYIYRKPSMALSDRTRWRRLTRRTMT